MNQIQLHRLQKEVSDSMRSLVVDWIIEVKNKSKNQTFILFT